MSALNHTTSPVTDHVNNALATADIVTQLSIVLYAHNDII